MKMHHENILIDLIRIYTAKYSTLLHAAKTRKSLCLHAVAVESQSQNYFLTVLQASATISAYPYESQ